MHSTGIPHSTFVVRSYDRLNALYSDYIQTSRGDRLFLIFLLIYDIHTVICGKLYSLLIVLAVMEFCEFCSTAVPNTRRSVFRKKKGLFKSDECKS